MVSAEIPQCSRHICELLFLIFVLKLNLLLLLNDWPLWLKRMGQRRGLSRLADAVDRQVGDAGRLLIAKLREIAPVLASGVGIIRRRD